MTPGPVSATLLVALLWLSGLALAGAGALFPNARRLTSALALLAPLLVFGLLFWLWPAEPGAVMAGQALRLDGFALFVQAFALLAVMGSLLLGRHAGTGWQPGGDGLLLLSAAGVSLLAMSTDLVGLLAGFVGTLVPLWGLSALSGGQNGREAALKELMASALGAVLLGFGAALVMASTSTTSLEGIRAFLLDPGRTAPVPAMVVAGLALSLAGVGIFVAAVPFHMWFADAVEGQPPAGGLLLTGGIMASGLAAVCRMLLSGFEPLVRAHPGPFDWTAVLHGVGLAALLIGNALALVQSRLKRMAAYLAAGQAGLVLVTLAAAGRIGADGTADLRPVVGGVLVFLAVHAVNWVGLFVAVGAIGDPEGGGPRVHHLEGLAHKFPWLAAALGLSLLCMAGMPLTAGFFARLYLLEAMVSAGWTWTAVAVALSLGLVLVMSLGLVAAMVMHPPAADSRVHLTPALSVMAFASSLAILVLGVLPGGVLNVAIQAAGFLAQR